MKYLILLFTLISTTSFGAGKLQNEDFKTLSQLVSAGGAMNQLLNDTKVYLTGSSQQLSTALSSGNIPNVAPGTSGNLMVSTGSAWTSQTINIAAPSQVIVFDNLGHGSTNTNIRRFNNANAATIGTDITYTPSATLGDIFTINTTATYSACWSDSSFVGQDFIAVTVNDSNISGTPQTMTYAQGRRGYTFVPGGNQFQQHCWTLYLTAGDIVRAHDDGSSDPASNACFFSIARVR